MTKTRIPTDRFVYINRLWETELFLTFDDNAIHLGDGESYNWKTGEKLSEAEPPTDKVNSLSPRDKERVLFCLKRIKDAYENEKD